MRKQVLLTSPVLSQRKLRQIMALPHIVEKHLKLDLYYDEAIGLKAAIEKLCDEAEAAVRGGAILLLLSDRYPVPGLLPIHALLAVGAVHARLTAKQLRCDCNLIVETGNARDAHHFACLIGFGATAVYPYLSYQTLFDMNRRGELKGREGEAPSRDRPQLPARHPQGPAQDHLEDGHLDDRRLSRRATVRDRRPGRTKSSTCVFPARRRASAAPASTRSKANTVRSSAAARDPNYALPPGGLLHALPEGEYHMYNPAVVGSLQAAVRTGDVNLYKTYADAVNNRAPSALRDLMEVALAARADSARRSRADRGDPQALRFGRHVARRAVARGARSAGDGDEPARRAQQFRRRRRRSGALRHRAHVEDQAGRLGPLRRHAGIPGQRRSAADQDRAGRQARRRRPAAGPQGQRADRAIALCAARHRADLAAAASRHLFDRGSGAADLRPERGQSAAHWFRSSSLRMPASARSPPAWPRPAPI